MENGELYKQFNSEVWRYFISSVYAKDRKGISFRAWVERTTAAKMAIHGYLSDYGSTFVQSVNPYFWLRDFPEPEPTNYNGARSFPDEPLVRAIYNGTGGLYTRREAELFNMQILGNFQL